MKPHPLLERFKAAHERKIRLEDKLEAEAEYAAKYVGEQDRAKATDRTLRQFLDAVQLFADLEDDIKERLWTGDLTAFPADQQDRAA